MSHHLYYDSEISLAKDFDFDFNSKLAPLGRLANLRERLLNYREHQASLSHRHTHRQDSLADLVSRRNLLAAGLGGS